MKKQELIQTIEAFIAEALTEWKSDKNFNVDDDKPSALRTVKKHINKYRKSSYHPDLADNPNKNPNGVATQFGHQDPGFEVPKNVQIFLNTTLNSLPRTAATDKVLKGLPVNKKEAMSIAKTMMGLPAFPFKQPRKLMNLIILLAIENSKG
jgi:hypothetical protein